MISNRIFEGKKEDIDTWMELVRKVRDNFPGLETEEALEEHKNTVLRFMGEQRALCVKEDEKVVGVILFSKTHNMICFLAVDPEKRRKGIGESLLSAALERLDRTNTISVSTFRREDKFGIAPRALYKKFGFEEAELTEEFGYPNQVFILYPKYKIVTLRDRSDLKETAAEWFHSKWGVPKEAYLSCMDSYLSKETEYGWYLCLDGEQIVGGMGVIANDFHDRKDLTPNVCAVYTKEEYRGQKIAGRLLNFVVGDCKDKKIEPLYLITDHIGFYERYGWEFFCMVQGDDEPEMTRMYIHR